METPLAKKVTLSAFVAAYYWEATGSGRPLYNTQQFLVGKETSATKVDQWSFGGGNSVRYFCSPYTTLLLLWVFDYLVTLRLLLHTFFTLFRLLLLFLLGFGFSFGFVLFDPYVAG